MVAGIVRDDVRMRRLSLLLPLAAVLLLGACGGGSSSASTTTAPSGARPSSTAKLSIVSPANGSVVHGSAVRVRLSLSGARIVKATSTVLRPDQGHVHLIMDGKLISMNYGLDDTIPGVPPGHHLLQAEFVANDHAPFDPRVIAVSSFRVKP
jgi:hypothetical protein